MIEKGLESIELVEQVQPAATDDAGNDSNKQSKNAVAAAAREHPTSRDGNESRAEGNSLLGRRARTENKKRTRRRGLLEERYISIREHSALPGVPDVLDCWVNPGKWWASYQSGQAMLHIGCGTFILYTWFNSTSCNNCSTCTAITSFYLVATAFALLQGTSQLALGCLTWNYSDYYDHQLARLSHRSNCCIALLKLVRLGSCWVHGAVLALLLYGWSLGAFLTSQCPDESSTLRQLLVVASIYSSLWLTALCLGSHCRRRFPLSGALTYPQLVQDSPECCGVDLSCSSRLQDPRRPRCCSTCHQAAQGCCSSFSCCKGVQHIVPQCLLVVGELLFQCCVRVGSALLQYRTNAHEHCGP